MAKHFEKKNHALCVRFGTKSTHFEKNVHSALHFGSGQRTLKFVFQSAL